MFVEISVNNVISIHDHAVGRYGGAFGILSFSLLDSAVNRMHASYGGEDLYVSVFEKAAALFHSLSKNHCFLDANKRTALASAIYFLRRNEVELDFERYEMEEFVLAVVQSELSFEEIVDFFKDHAQ